ncbi:CaiB/BaiF CoA-transferase family protein [Pseudorhodoferax sp. Leaf267]|uniref:CaiB/BaiF CoA transferase family protein n=1 Tax=Pseudorhodoferax sp. Leaf267 TaxID=1736316 RepID=UPI0007143D2A|nr:CoA transferase [Pseudorhodoferax sp. Leaf267]KQP14194.1 hypothetical protein ASF43_15305 [Pseudorhodoferax sp. Leaf267]
MSQAMKGLRVLDLSMGVAGPHAGMLCRQHGAEVVKVESPGGDWARTMGRQFGDLSSYMVAYNRGKQSLAVDFQDLEALAIVQRAAGEADVVIESFRSGVLARHGLDYASVRRANPRVVYLSVTGFGQTGPMATLPATDGVMQGFSGFMHMNAGADGVPRRVDMVMMDVITGLYAFQAITTALLERAQGATEGKYIDCSLMQSAIAFQTTKLAEMAAGGMNRAMYAPLGVMRTADGNISISVMRDKHFVALCHALGRDDLALDPRYASRDSRLTHEAPLMAALRAEFERRTTEQIADLLEEAGVLHTRVLSYEQLLAHPQVEHQHAVAWAEQDGLAQRLPLGNVPGAQPFDTGAAQQAPHIGQQSRAVLAGWGVPAHTIDALVARGAVRQWSPAA